MKKRTSLRQVSLWLLPVMAAGAILCAGPVPARADDGKAREVLAAAVEAMGGETYLKVNSSHGTGNFFFFSRGRKAFAKFFDWTVYEPVKSRFQLGEGRRQQVRIHNLELNQGWLLEGRSSVEPLSEEEMKEFERAVRQDLDIILRKRLDEEGASLFYYSPDDIAGQGEYEAVEFLDASNDSVVIFFHRNNRLPAKVESHFTNKLGIRLKQEVEFYQWHSIQGVLTPLRIDIHVDGELVQQRFVEKIAYNVAIPEDYFREPVVDKK